MKFTWKISLTVVSVIIAAVLILHNSPDGLIYALSTLLALSGIWQVSQVKAVLNTDIKPPQTNTQGAQSSKKYWLKRIGVFSLIVITGVIAESVWWITHPKSISADNKENEITQNLPLSYVFKKPLWQLGIIPLPKLKEIPAGEFQMGSEQYNDEKPVHQVTIPQAFLMAQTEITFEQYDYYIWDLQRQGISTISYLDSEGLEVSQDLIYPDDQGWGHDKHPVINVSWHAAQGYVNWLSKKIAQHCRLPSEAEWEYAARAGTTTAYPWGDNASHNSANYGQDECCDGLAEGKDKWVNTAPVASFKANKFGLYDMQGNVYEWVQDCYHGTYKNASKVGVASEDKKCGRRVFRGGSWGNTPNRIRSAYRLVSTPGDRYDFIGFRVVCLSPSTDH